MHQALLRDALRCARNMYFFIFVADGIYCWLELHVLVFFGFSQKLLKVKKKWSKVKKGNEESLK